MFYQSILKKYEDVDIISRKKAMLLFYFNIAVSIALFFMSIALYAMDVPNRNLWIKIFCVEIFMSFIDMILIYLKKYAIAAYIFVICSYILGFIIVMSYHQGESFYTVLLFYFPLLGIAFTFINERKGLIFGLLTMVLGVIYALYVKDSVPETQLIMMCLCFTMVVIIIVIMLYLLTIILKSANTQNLVLLNSMKEHAITLSEASLNQASTIEQVAASLEEISSVATMNADAARSTRDTALNTVPLVEEGDKAVQETVNALKDIIDKVNIIEEIAMQTQMLSLNTAIEASHAGKYGKGFQVIANEVRNLAETSKRALKEIKELSIKCIAVSEQSNRLSNKIVPIFREMSEQINSISLSSDQQNISIQQISEGIQLLSQVIQSNTATSEQMASFSKDLFSSNGVS